MPSITMKPHRPNQSTGALPGGSAQDQPSNNSNNCEQSRPPKRTHSLSTSLKNLFIHKDQASEDQYTVRSPKRQEPSKRENALPFKPPQPPPSVVTSTPMSSDKSNGGSTCVTSNESMKSPSLRSKAPALPAFAEEGFENTLEGIPSISKPSDVYLPSSTGAFSRGREPEIVSIPRALRSRSQSRAKAIPPCLNLPNTVVGTIRIYENALHEHVLKPRKVLEKIPNSTGILSGFLKKSSTSIRNDVAFSLLPEQNRMDFQRRLSIQSSKLEEDSEESDSESGSETDGSEDSYDEFEDEEEGDSGSAAIGDSQLKLINKLVEQINNDEDPSLSTRNYKLSDKYGKPQGIIGKGAYGLVKLVSKIDSATKKEIYYAVKELKKKEKEETNHFSERLTSEFVISNALNHINIVKTIDLMKNSSGIYSEVMEYCSAGDLYSLILQTNREGLHYLEADCFMKQIMRGLSYMHLKGIAHCDIKPENILLTTSGICKISDFGTSAVFRTAWEKECHFSAGACGSEPYVAPEEFVAKEYDPRSVDVWSAGVVYLTMNSGGYVWEVAKDEDDLFQDYLRERPRGDGRTGTFEPIETLKSGSFYKSRKATLYAMLDPNPKARLTSHEVLKSSWLQHTILCEAVGSEIQF